MLSPSGGAGAPLLPGCVSCRLMDCTQRGRTACSACPCGPIQLPSARPPDLCSRAPRCSRGREEHPVRTLDELFRKTTAKPCIYWLPLTGVCIGAPALADQRAGVGCMWACVVPRQPAACPAQQLCFLSINMSASCFLPRPSTPLQMSRLLRRSARRLRLPSRRSSRRPTALPRRSEEVDSKDERPGLWQADCKLPCRMYCTPHPLGSLVGQLLLHWLAVAELSRVQGAVRCRRCQKHVKSGQV